MPLPITQWKDQEKAKAKTRQKRRRSERKDENEVLQQNQMSPGRTDHKQPTAANGRHAATWVRKEHCAAAEHRMPVCEFASRQQTPRAMKCL